MTQEEYEAKVQSMPHELQKTFREALEMSLSKRIVNRFMSTVMQAYAWGQRTAQKVSQDDAYMRGTEDMLEAFRTISSMGYEDMQKYFPGRYNSDASGIRMVFQMNPGDILEIVDKFRDDKMQEKDEREKVAVHAMADTIGIDRLLEIANAIKQEDELPY